MFEIQYGISNPISNRISNWLPEREQVIVSAKVSTEVRQASDVLRGEIKRSLLLLVCINSFDQGLASKNNKYSDGIKIGFSIWEKEKKARVEQD